MGERLLAETTGDSGERSGGAPHPAQRELGRHAGVLHLQRTIGNRAVGRLVPRMLARQKAAAGGGGLQSRLVGRKRSITWDDFKGKPDAASPYEAQTKVTVDVKIDGAKAGESSFEGSGDSFTLKDKVVVTVDLDRKSCWKKSSIDDASDLESRLMLEHEQGHYDIAALMARDMFIEIMALKGRTFASKLDGSNELRGIVNRYGPLLKTVDALYDSSGETGHRAIERLSIGPPRKPTAQAKWEGYIHRAFTQPRTPAVTAPDGATYKVPLVQVLRGAGLQV